LLIGRIAGRVFQRIKDGHYLIPDSLVSSGIFRKAINMIVHPGRIAIICPKDAGERDFQGIGIVSVGLSGNGQLHVSIGESGVIG